MKRTSTIFSLVIGISIIGCAINTTNGQGRGRERDSDRTRDRADHQDRTNYNDRDRHDNDRDHRESNRRHKYDRHSVKHVYHHDRRHIHQPVVVHHYVRPRYIYYRDYDVYYDRNTSVYISYSGRGWTVSSALPVVMHRVNIRNTKRFEVDYYDDDFPRYLETRRPSYGRECEDW
jgi:hypothetical protein